MCYAYNTTVYGVPPDDHIVLALARSCSRACSTCVCSYTTKNCCRQRIFHPVSHAARVLTIYQYSIVISIIYTPTHPRPDPTPCLCNGASVQPDVGDHVGLGFAVQRPQSKRPVTILSVGMSVEDTHKMNANAKSAQPA